MRASPRILAGILLKDAVRYERALRSRHDQAWLALANRRETVAAAPEGVGVECRWTGTSVLHAPTVVPGWGRRLMRRALARDPVLLRDAPATTAGAAPEVSFVVVHRGLARLPLLLATLRSLAAQGGVACECVVAEESHSVEIRDALPPWVRHAHRPSPGPDTPFNRAAAFNTGVKAARGRVVILHDNDLLAPVGYAREALRLADAGYEVVNHKRFLFYLSEPASRSFLSSSAAELPCSIPETVLQNATGGGSLALTREAFEAIGGLDESFVGWGGEDVEFWQRALTRRVWPYGHMPLFHLWHSPQALKDKFSANTPARSRLARLAEIPLAERIAALRAASHGRAGARDQVDPVAPGGIP